MSTMTQNDLRTRLRDLNDDELADLLEDLEHEPDVIDRDEKHDLAMQEARSRPFAVWMCPDDRPGAASVAWALARQALFGVPKEES